MSCKCSTSCVKCPYTVKSTEIAVNGEFVDITIPSVVLRNHQPLCVILAQKIPTNVTADMTVRFVFDCSSVVLLTPRTNFVYGDQLCTRKMLRTRIATDTHSATLINCACIRCTNHNFDTIPAATTPISTKTTESNNSKVVTK